jgi:hypothetical protein
VAGDAVYSASGINSPPGPVCAAPPLNVRSMSASSPPTFRIVRKRLCAARVRRIHRDGRGPVLVARTSLT